MKTNLESENRNWPRENAARPSRNPAGARNLFHFTVQPFGGLRTCSDFSSSRATKRNKFRDPKSPLQSLLRSALYALCVLMWQSALADVYYVDVNSTNATPPYLSWSTAATNIQDAVDAALAGDEVVVTNGIY